MKLKLDSVLFINLLFRIFLLIYLLKDERLEKPKSVRTVRHWLDPISKRVILIFVNGLEKNFLSQNSTPYLREMLDNYGSFGVALTGYMQTNFDGIKTVLTGKRGSSFGFSWMTQEMERHCHDNVMDYVSFSCGMGNLPMDLSWRCYFPDENPLGTFHKFPGLFEMNRRKSSLYIMSIDLDPIFVRDYRSRLTRIDDDIRFFAAMVDSFHGDNKTTYIVTSARGSPVGKSLSVDAPVVAWGSGIRYNDKTTYLKQTDLTAMLSALLGINFPSGTLGIIPMAMMDLEEYYELELTLYTIKHFELVLEKVDLKNHLYHASELELAQLSRRFDHIVLKIQKEKLIKWSFTCFLLILLQTVWGANLTSYASSGHACFFWHLKSLFLLLLVVGSTLTYSLLGLELLVAVELLLFCTWQNFNQIRDTVQKHALTIFKTILFTFISVTVVGLMGNQIAVPLMLVPVVLWSVFDGSYLRLNRYVVVTRLLSGIVLGSLPLRRVFGETPDRAVMATVSFLFLINFYLLLSIFKRKFDDHIRINFLVILAATAHVYFVHQYESLLAKDALSCFFLSFAFFSAYVASGTLLEKLLKILLSLLIPVLMMSIRFECVFYLSVFFQVFSWIFTDYHTANPIQYKFHPAVFSLGPRKPLKAIRFSDEDARLVVSFLVYSYAFYFAFGHFPDLHSYDLYVLPKFFYPYPGLLSYFLGAFKFFLPFFVVTASFLTLCLVKEKSFKPLMLVVVWVSDLVGSSLIFYSQFVNHIFQETVFPAKFSYFVIQQFATVSVILSYFLAKHLLLDSNKFLLRISRKWAVTELADSS